MLVRTVLRAVLLCGIPVSVLGILAAAAVMTAAELPFSVYPFAAALPVLGGCLLAGCRAGKRARRGGLRCGLLAALLLTGLWYAAACLLCGRMRIPRLLLLTLPCGMLGGTAGVNTKLPLPHRKIHALRKLPLRLTLAQRVRKGIHRARRNSPKTDSNDAKNC